jgi:hypothetical protein
MVEPVEFRYRQLKSGWEKHVQSCQALVAPGILSYTPGAIAVFEEGTALNFLRWLFEAQTPFGRSALIFHEVPGNIFGPHGPLGGMRRTCQMRFTAVPTKALLTVAA